MGSRFLSSCRQVGARAKGEMGDISWELILICKMNGLSRVSKRKKNFLKNVVTFNYRLHQFTCPVAQVGGDDYPQQSYIDFLWYLTTKLCINKLVVMYTYLFIYTYL